MQNPRAQLRPNPHVELDSPCDEWPGFRNRKGYGQAGRHTLVHRAAWEAVHGPIPDGVCVLHRCDNPPCVSPAHLFLGTKAENNRDMHAKGRGSWGGLVFGIEHHSARLDSEKVREIRRRHSAGESPRALAAEFGVSRETIWKVATRRNWKAVV